MGRVKALMMEMEEHGYDLFERGEKYVCSHHFEDKYLNGYIKKYIAVLDAQKLNQGFVVFCNVKMHRMSHDIAEQFSHMVKGIPEVTECYNVSGSFDYLLKVHAANMKYYREFVLNVLGSIEGLGSIESTFVMDTIKNDYGIHF